MMNIGASGHEHRGDPSAAACEPLTFDHLLEVAFAFWRSALLLTAHDLGIFASVANEPLDAATLIARLDLVPEEAPDFLAALVAAGLLAESAGRYRNTWEAQRFLNPAGPDYIGAYLAMAGTALGAVADLPGHLRVIRAPAAQTQDLATRMWEDIAAILQSAGADRRL